MSDVSGPQVHPPVPARTMVLRRRVRLIITATISYNVIEAIIAIAAGTVASSGALVAFGLDSTVEVLSAAAVAWQFAGRDPEAREAVTLRVIAFAFFAMAAYVSISAIRTLIVGSEPEHSSIGIILAAVSLVVMPLLSWLERRTGQELGSASVVADSKQTLICAYLSGVLLAGLVLNSAFEWWWADPIAALAIAIFAIREGIEAWRGDTCATPVGTLLDETAGDGHDHHHDHDHGDGHDHHHHH